TLQNREVSRDLNGAKGVLVSFSKDAATGDRLYAMHKVEFEINLRAQSKMEQSTPSVSLTYYQDSGNRDGVKEHGCVLIVLDSTGAVQHVDSSVPGAEKFAKEIMALTVPCVLDRNFRVNASLTLPGEIVLNP
ncbi:MAG: hypothetical protein JNG86_22920, partial [Verrucomicrobiaceae bacterium]|nr:hypothetical protein [Verrucomicrobiaceae bacterium]